MANKKKPGVERPYTIREFVHKLEKLAQDQHVVYMDQTDYLTSALDHDREITNPYADLTMRVAYGSSEGIYADVMLRTEGIEQELLTAKTLGETQEDFVAISTMAAHLCYIGKKYIREHKDEFCWKGHEVDFYDDERSCGGYSLIPKDDIDEVAMRGVESGHRVVIRDNVTRREWEYKPKEK